MKRQITSIAALAALLCLGVGCAFDLVSVKQTPASFVPISDGTNSFVLVKGVTVKMGTGFPTVLKPSTSWRQIGKTEFGEVYSTRDQIVKVEASNIHEAYLVVSNGCLVGFYLPVEKAFSPLKKPISLETKNVGQP